MARPRKSADQKAADKAAKTAAKQAGTPPGGLPLGATAPAAVAQPIIAAPAGPVKPHAVDLKDYKDGSFKMLRGDQTGETFKLRIVRDDPRGRTHHLKNETHFWEGTEADFRQHFEKQ